MKLNKYLFNTVNNKELGRGQRSVVWLKHGQPCLHQLHVLSTVFSWQPLSSFSLWIILLPSDSCCFLLFVQTVFSFFVVFGYAWFFVQSLFLRNLGQQFWRDVHLGVWPWLFAWLFRLFHGLKVRQQLFCGFSAETDRLWFCVHLPSSQVAHELSDQAVQRA